MGKISTDEIERQLEEATGEELTRLILQYSQSDKAGVRKLAQRAQKRLEDLEREKQRMYELFSYEREHGQYDLICGVDEAGRGPWVGPVVAGAVILPKDCDILYINDSKKLSEKKREELYEIIREKAVAWAVGMASHERIDEINIRQATIEAMQEAVEKLSPSPQFLLLDAITLPGVKLPQLSLIKGDALSASIGAASIMAKVTRDRMLLEYDKQYPEYHFAKNKGYGTKEHMEALSKYGPTPIHRRTFITKYVADGK